MSSRTIIIHGPVGERLLLENDPDLSFLVSSRAHEFCVVLTIIKEGSQTNNHSSLFEQKQAG